MDKDIFKSIWAVFAGFVIVAILSIATDMLLEYLGIFPSITTGLFVTWMLVLALIYRSIYTVLGGYVTAKLAPKNSERHVWILGGIGVVAGTLGAIANWDKSYHWYPILIVVLALPCTWLGGKLKTK